MTNAGPTLLVQLPVVTMLVAWAGIVISFYALQTFNLRDWQIATYVFMSGLVAFMLYAFIESFYTLLPATGVFHIVGDGLKLLSILFITGGILKARQTAKKTGA